MNDQFTTEELNNLVGQNVYDVTGDKIGVIESVYVDENNNTPTFISATTNWFGTDVHFIPVRGAKINNDQFIVNYTKEKIKASPHIAPDSFVEDKWQDELLSYYNLNGAISNEENDIETEFNVEQGYREKAEMNDVDNDKGNTEEKMTLHEEDVNVGTERRESGKVKLKKYIVEDKETIAVPKRKEVVRVVTDDAKDKSPDQHELNEQEIEVTTHEDVPVINKSIRPTKTVGIQREEVMENQAVNATARREELKVDKDDASRDIMMDENEDV